jgi:hypothetical protein
VSRGQRGGSPTVVNLSFLDRELLYQLSVILLHRVRNFYVRFEVFAAVTMNNTVFWDVTPCGSYRNQSFGGIASPSSG